MPEYAPDPPLECDVVMKGGITSGVIYPSAVCALASVYRLRSVGGASAGAIAAAAAAAAEYGRAHGGFERLAAVPDEVGGGSPAGGSVLSRLFQPSRSTSALFAVATAGLGRRGAARVAATVVALVRCAPVTAVAGGLLGAAVVVLGLSGTGAARAAAVIGGLVLLVGGLLLGAVLGTVRRAGRDLPQHGFGLCSGMPSGRRRHRGTPALVPWLHGLLQELAGSPSTPLTFGDLTGRGCDLRMMTTDLALRQPLEMPWADRRLFFDPDRFRGLFPDEVVDWMVAHPPPLPDDPSRRWASELLRLQAGRLRPLPAPEHLPVVVATRMSLSFPVLIAAVPLYAVDYAEPDNRRARDAADRWRADHPGAGAADALAELPRRRFATHWFSDGGICTNLPVHFFDRALPRRPTFAIDLAPYPPGRTRSADETENSALPEVNQGGVLRRRRSWRTTGFGALADFGGSILASARSWVDESLVVMPGYRDRVVTIYHDDDEGGLNLTMTRDVVTRLSLRGHGAGERLVRRFAGDAPGVVDARGWRNQQWIRFRTAMLGLDDWLDAFERSYHADGTSFRDLAGGNARADLPSYRVDGQRRRAVNGRTDDLITLARSWAGHGPDDALRCNAPSPAPALRLVPAERAGRPAPTATADRADSGVPRER